MAQDDDETKPETPVAIEIVKARSTAKLDRLRMSVTWVEEAARVWHSLGLHTEADTLIAMAQSAEREARGRL